MIYNKGSRDLRSKSKTKSDFPEMLKEEHLPLLTPFLYIWNSTVSGGSKCVKRHLNVLCEEINIQYNVNGSVVENKLQFVEKPLELNTQNILSLQQRT